MGLALYSTRYPNTHLTVVVNNALRNSLMPEGEWAAMRDASGR
jgi:hypothetical protein